MMTISFALFRVLLLSFGAWLSFSPLAMAAKESSPIEQAEQSSLLPVEDIRRFVQVLSLVHRQSVEDVSQSTLIEYAIKGILSNLDPHSSYLDKRDFQVLKDQTKGQYGGLGITIASQNKMIYVISPIEGSPADKAGVQNGDLIFKINQTPTQNLTLNEAVDIMRGKVGQSVVLSILRKGKNKPLVLKIVREEIKIPSVGVSTLDKNYLWLRVASFGGQTYTELVEKVRALKRSNSSYRGIILDLRGNGGGLLDTAVKLSDAFLSKGVIVSIRGKNKALKESFKAHAKTFFGVRVPVVVLIDEGSASASEIVAGALQDRKRAIVMGRRSFGKGSVQTVFPLGEQQGLRLTTALYFTPSGRSIQAKGIEPDIKVKPLKLEKGESFTLFSYKESDLKNHINNPSDKTSKGSISAEKADKALQPWEKDYLLGQALNLLKGLQWAGGLAHAS